MSQKPERSGGWTFRDGRSGQFGILFAAVWLVFLTDPLKGAWQKAWSDHDRLDGWVGVVSTVGFAAAYIVVFAWLRRRRQRLARSVEPMYAALVLGGLFALMLAMCVSIGQAGTAAVVYIAVISVVCLPARSALFFTAGLATATEVSGHLVPGWSNPGGLTFAVCTAAFAMWGVSQLMARNVDLVAAEEENARLAVADERNRFARDLHDILGHSLTVITVKAELANRLLDVDPARARSELADLERLSRDALADVRRAVEGYHELSLTGELARAQVALEAAGIRARLPNTTDEVPSDLRELFAWTVREGVTNVIRHSGATTCEVRFRDGGVEVSDDGRGPVAEPSTPDAGRTPGHGLVGLRERAGAVGAVLVTRSLEPRGFSLQVSSR